MRRAYTAARPWQRIGAFLLAFVMVMGMAPQFTMPVAAEFQETANGLMEKVVDDPTLYRNESIYPDNTRNAGKVSVGKTVLSAGQTLDGQSLTLTNPEDFLVVLSQAAQVMGLSSEMKVPVDVVFVLDTSGSMGQNTGRAEAMVEAANTAIEALMAANEENRVGVVAFSGQGQGGGTSGGAPANVLSALAHYEDINGGDAASHHLKWVDSDGERANDTSGNNRNYIAGRTMTGSNNVNAYRHGKNGGTNIHMGIALGAQQLAQVQDVTYTDPDTGKVVHRIPFLIILSDGQPTRMSADSTWYAPTDTDQKGNGSDPFEGVGFVTALTAAYYKGLITEHYYGDKATATDRCYVYTMGVQVGELTDDDLALAQITLDPKTYTGETYLADNQYNYWLHGNSYNDTNRWDVSTATTTYGWKTYWDNYVAGSSYNVRVNDSDGYGSSTTNNFQISATSITATKKYVNGLDGKYQGGIAYNDAYYNVDNVDQMTDVFNQVLTSIQEKAVTVPTDVSSGDYDFDGYVTITDPLGEYMEFKEMKGIIADNTFYRGRNAATYLANFGKADGNAAFEEMIRNVLKTRLGLTNSAQHLGEDVDRVIENLLTHHTHNNTMVWYGREYIGSNGESQMQLISGAGGNADANQNADTVEYIQDNPNAAPANATHVCRSYFFYGEAGGDTGAVVEHQYLYFVVRVQRSLTAPYNQTVVVSIPASLLSVEQVMVTETFDENGNAHYSLKVEEDEPLRVVYEVGLWDNITSENVSAVVSGAYADEKPTDGQGQANVTLNDQGQEVYHFFTNDWDRTKSQESHERAMAKAYFEAASDNSYYTYQEDTLLVDEDGTALTTEPEPGSTAYYVRTYYDWSNASLVDGVYQNVTEETTRIQVTLPSDLTGVVIEKDGKFYIAAGVYTGSTVAPGEMVTKVNNPTGTSQVVAMPVRTGEANNSHYTVYQGNNGMVSLVSDPPVPKKTVSNVTPGKTEILDANGKAVMVGDVLEYTIEAKNYKTEPCDLIVTDTVPAGTVLATYPEGAENAGDYIITYEAPAGMTVTTGYDKTTGKITWTFGNVEAGATVKASFQVKVAPSALEMQTSTIQNQATVHLGENGPTYESNITTNPPEGKKNTFAGGGEIEGTVKVGDQLRYTIEYFNDTDETATVTITDTLPEGTTFLSAENGGTLGEDGQTITWTISDVAAGTGSFVTFLVQVNASAMTPLENSATIKIGDNDPKTTNTTELTVATGDLTITKTVASGASTKEFTLTLADPAGKLSGVFSGVEFQNGQATVTIQNGQTITIEGLPAGAVINVTEAEAQGWTPTYQVNGEAGSRVTILERQTVGVAVTNNYQAEPAYFSLPGTKFFTGASFPDRTTFTIRATECDEHGVPVTEPIVVTAQPTYIKAEYDEATGVTFSLSGRYFDEEVDRYYLITEDPTQITGVTTDTRQYLLHLVIRDNGEGAWVVLGADGENPVSESNPLPVKVRANADAEWGTENVQVKFENKYAPLETTLSLSGKKVLTNRTTLNPGDFSFLLIDGNGDAESNPNFNKTIHTALNDAQGNFSFPNLVYTAADMGGATPKEFRYYIRENLSSGLPNVTFDESIYDVTVTVTEAEGKLNAAVTSVVKYGKDAEGQYVVDNGFTVNDTIQFNNIYQVQNVYVTPQGTKVLTGRTMVEGEFSFNIYHCDGNGVITDQDPVSTGTNDANGNIGFSRLGFTLEQMKNAAGSYDTEKTFYFLVKENVPVNVDPNMYYDPAEYLVEAKITYDPVSGTLSAPTAPTLKTKDASGAWQPLAQGTGIVFHNIQNPGYTSVVPSGFKQIENNPGNVVFSFEVVDKEGNVVSNGRNATVDQNDDGKLQVDFRAINYTTPTEPGQSETHRYTIREVNGGQTINGVTYTNVKYQMEVTVTRTETLGWQTSVEYFTAEGTPITANDVVFENKYDAQGSFAVSAVKKLDNGDLNEIQGFKFYLTQVDSTGAEVGEPVLGTITQLADQHTGYISFPSLIFEDNSILNGDPSVVLTYKLTEEQGNHPGVTYDTEPRYIYIKLTDGADGGIDAELVADAEGTPFAETPDDASTAVIETGVTFTNTYTVTTGVEVVLEANKTLNGRELEAGEFGFVLERWNAAGDGTTGEWVNVTSGSNTVDPENTNQGSVTFLRRFDGTNLPLRLFSDNKYTILYRIREADGGLGGVSYDTGVYYAEVVITHVPSESKYECEVSYYAANQVAFEGAVYSITGNSIDGSAVTFTNTYTTNEISITPAANKLFLGAEDSDGNRVELDPSGFNFQVIVVDENGAPEFIQVNGENSYSIVTTGTSGSTGAVKFGNVVFSNETGGTDCGGACGTEGCGGTLHPHYYQIIEPQGTNSQITYTTEAYYLKVVIHNNGEGVLSVLNDQMEYGKTLTGGKIGEKAASTDDVKFTNYHGTYELNLELEPALTKRFETTAGNDYIYHMSGSEFDFAVYSDPECTVEVTRGSNGHSDHGTGVAPIIFTTIVIDKDDMVDDQGSRVLEKTFTYYIKELPRSGAPFITIDNRVIVATVTVTDDGYGNMSAVTTYAYKGGEASDDVAFVNKYEAEGTSVALDIIKELSGKNLVNEKFTFVLYDAQGKEAARTQNTGNMAQIVLNYAAADMSGAEFNNGIYTKVLTYTLKELTTVENGGSGTYTYDNSVYDVTVTLTDNGSGQLSAAVMVELHQDASTAAEGQTRSAPIRFHNSYTPNPVTADLSAAINAVKRVVDPQGNSLTPEEVSFTFKVTDQQGTPIVDKDGAAITGTANGTEVSNAVVFDEFVFDRAGEYRYLITETAVSKNGGYTMDTQVWCVHITVNEDLNTGVLSVADAVYTHKVGGESTSDEDPVFTNTYTTNDVSLNLNLRKELTGRPLRNGEFTFTLYNAEGTIAATGANDVSGRVTLRLNYTQQDLGDAASKTFTYTLKEDQGSAPGVEYWNGSQTVTVVLTDDGSGKLSVSVNGKAVDLNDAYVGGAAPFAAIENTYTAEAVTVGLQAIKRMEGMPLKAGAYEFQLKDGETVVAEGSNALDGKISFKFWNESTQQFDLDVLTFTEQDMAGADSKEFKYTMVEVKGDAPGVTFDGTSFDVTITVKDNYNGQLEAKVVYSTNAGIHDQPVFINIYNPNSTSTVIKAQKELTGRPLEGGEFSFTLSDADGAELETVQNDKDGNVIFSQITYDKVGTHTYTIREQEGTKGGVTYDQEKYTVIVTVSDKNYDGQLDVKVVYEDKDGNAITPEEVVFHNTYVASSVTDVVIQAEKILDGRQLDADEFTFVLKAGETEVLTAQNKADGTVTFEPLTFTHAMMVDAEGKQVNEKQFTYTLTEKAGNLGGVAYSREVYTVVVTVTDDWQGSLSASVEYKLGDTTVQPGDVKFTNEYTATPATGVQVSAAKVLTGRTQNAGEFTFVLTGEGKRYTAVNKADGTVEFDGLTFNKADTYTYTLSEQTGTLGGVTYSTVKYTVTITVTDNQKGQLVAAVAYTDAEGKPIATAVPQFENKYQAEKITGVQVSAAKVLTGRTQNAGEFTFVLAGEGQEYTATNKADGTVEFEGLTFDQAGTYTYTLSEQTGTLGGVTYSTVKYTVTITVTDNLDGTLSAVVAYTDAEGKPITSAVPQFENKYQAKPVTGVTVQAKKDMTGRPLVAEEYTFVLAGEGQEYTATNKADGTVEFEGLTFDKAGIYNYTLSERTGTDLGVAYDAKLYNVTVTVTDDWKGQLHGDVTYTYEEDSQTKTTALPGFKNVYTPGRVNINLQAKKTLTGMVLDEGRYTFELYKNGVLVDTASNSLNGEVVFDALTFDAVGTYVYTLSERKGDLGGVTYDETVYTATITVTDEGYDGQLDVAVVYSDANGPITAAVPEFKNAYQAKPVTGVIISVGKTLTGRTQNAGEFTFVLAGEGKRYTAVNKADGTVEFQGLDFDKAGTYTYTLSEEKGTLGGVTYSEVKYTVTVTVTDDWKGQLHAAVAYTDANGDPITTAVPEFKNEYQAKPVTDVKISGNKTLTGRDLAAGEFSFVLTDANGKRFTAVNDKDGKVVFQGLTFNQAGTYVYTLSEEKGTLGGVTYSEVKYTVTVTVTDDWKGQLHAAVAYTDAQGKAADPVFENKYQAKPVTDVTVSANKVLTGRKLKDGEFTFVLTDAQGNETARAVNKADGTVTIQGLTFDQVGVYNFALTELVPAEADKVHGVSYDTASVYAVTITVTDDGKGQLHAAVDYHGEDVVFTNVFTPDPVKVTFQGTKELTGKKLTDGAFTFSMKDENNKSYVVTNDASGSLVFPELSFGQVGTYTYTIREVAGEDQHIAYDKAEFTAVVTVTKDEQTGVLTAQVNYSEPIAFRNVHTPDAVNVELKGSKVLTGKKLTEGVFQFHLTDEKGNVTLVTNRADGSLKFPVLTFTEAGTYSYTLSEVKGNDSHITYDDAVFEITVNVTLDELGVLSAAVDYKGKDIVFHNEYTPDPAQVVIVGEKKLLGRDLTAGEFQFQVKNAEGKVVSTGTNTAEGTIIFEPIAVSGTGEMMLTVSEVKGSDAEVIYDTKTFQAKVVVTNEDGVLKADVTYPNGAVEFTNKYSKTPDTGDDSNPMFYITMMAASALAILVLGFGKKRKKFF